MSDTDSDLDFESADEETEQELSEKSNVAAHSSANNDAEKNLNEQFSSNVNISVNNSDLIDKNDEVSNETSELISNENSADQQVKSSLFSELAAENTGKCVSNDPQHAKQFNEITDEKAKNSSTSTIENTAESAPNDSQPEKQRVTLRLEKKLKQKHGLPKQISSETEESSFAVTPTQSGGKPSSWGFSSWGTSLLSTAASSVTTFTSQVSQGIGTVLETVENTLGVPPPEELASAQNKPEDTNDSPSETKVSQSAESSNSEKTEENEKSESRPTLLPDVSSWTKVLENTGSKVIMGGLDTLEMIGKKTIDILTEGDPGLRKKRAAFSPNMNLSQLLREAKAAADEKDEPSSEDIDRVHYSQIFDEYQGLVHLEALEMLSRQSQAKIQRLMIKYGKNTEVKNKLEDIQTICENLPSADDLSECEKLENFELELKKYAVQLNLPLNVDNIVKVQRKIDANIKKHSNTTEISEATPEEIYRSAIHSLAEFTSKCIEAFQKVAELILVQSTLEQNLEQCATNLTGMTTVMCLEVDNLSSRYHSCLDSLQSNPENPVQFKAEDITFKVTNLYLEAGHSNKYIQDAYMLLVPVLQLSLLENLQ
ncbi:Protein FAM114A2, partial [Stegodyphus mimosarum]